MSKIYYKLEIQNSGGEFAYGIITDKEEQNLLKERVEDGDVALCNTFDDGTEINFYDNTNVVHCYGPNADGALISLTSYEDEKLEKKIETIFSDENTSLHLIRSSPQPEDAGIYLEDVLGFGGYSVEKRIVYTAVIELDKSEKFDIDRVFVSGFDLYELLFYNNQDALIVDKVYYFNTQVLKDIVDEFDFDVEDLSDLDMWGIVDDYRDTSGFQELLSKAETSTPFDIEGKGEREFQEAFIWSYEEDDQELIFEGSCDYAN